MFVPSGAARDTRARHLQSPLEAPSPAHSATTPGLDSRQIYAYTVNVMRQETDGAYAEIADLCTCQSLRKAARVVTQVYDDALRPTGLRATQLPILVALCRQGPVTVNGLAEALVTDPTTITRNLRPLEREGLLALREGADRRERHVEITGKGRRVLGRAVPLWKKAQGRIARDVGGQRLGRLVADLRALVDGVRTT